MSGDFLCQPVELKTGNSPAGRQIGIAGEPTRKNSIAKSAKVQQLVGVNTPPNDGLKEIQLTCPNCRTNLIFGKDVQNAKRQTKKGDIMVCSNCSMVSRVGDGGLVQMSREEIGKLDKQTQFMLGVAVASVLNAQDEKKPLVSVNGIR